MIKAQNCSLKYKDGTQALKPFSLEINSGELIFITGPSGSGKTSFLKLIMGIEKPTEGDITVLDLSLKNGKESDIRTMRTQMGPIFQDFRLLEGRSVLENVMLGLRFLDYKHGDMKRLATEYIVRVGLEHKLDHTVDRLSWGECQRVAIARAVARKPRLIVADEPTGNLDQTNAINVLELLASFVDANTSVLITTHATHLVSKVPWTTRLQMQNGAMTIERSVMP